MNCPFCHAENPESAAFCKKCGKPMNGLLPCPVCGEQSPADGDFCIACGARLRSDDVPPPAAEQHATAFTETPDEQPAAPPQETHAETRRGILMTVSETAALAAAFLALIFTFCIGCVTTEYPSDGMGGSEVSLYYYFSEAYDGLLFLYSAGFPFTEWATLLPAILGTIVGVCAIISALTLFTLTLVCYLRRLTGKTDKQASHLAIWTVLAFFLCAALFSAVHALRITMEGGDSTATARVGSFAALNGASIAGIALCSVLLLAAVVLAAIARRDKLCQQTRVRQYAFSAAAILFAVVIAALIGGECLAMRVYTLNLTDDGYYFETITNVGTGFLGALYQLASLDYNADWFFSDNHPERCSTIVGSCAGGALAQFGAIASLVCLMAMLLTGIAEGEVRKTRILISASMAALFTILSAAFAGMLTPHATYLTETYVFTIAWDNTLSGNVRASTVNLIVANCMCAVMLLGLIVYASLPAPKRKER